MSRIDVSFGQLCRVLRRGEGGKPLQGKRLIFWELERSSILL